MKNSELKVDNSECCTPANGCNASHINEVQKDTSTLQQTKLPIVIIGAGPIGLAAAAELASRKQSFILLEAGSAVGQNIREWGHVRLFSPWQYNVSKAAKALLVKHSWQAPPDDELPLGKQLVDQYLEPLAELPEIKPFIKLNAKVIAVSKKDTDKMKSANREQQPFVIYFESKGVTNRVVARAVIDATGTWSNPNPLYASGVWTKEERALNQHIFYGIPELDEENKLKYKGKRIAVVGGGHSAINTLLDLALLKEADPETELYWILRKRNVEEAYGGEANDQLEARGELGSRIHKLVSSQQIQVFTPFKIEELIQTDQQVQITGIVQGERTSLVGMDQIIVNTGSRPDFSFLKELRLSIDPATESAALLAPLIDPNVHSCGTVRAHGHKELQHPEKHFYIAGMKSYGRAPTFLLATGYEQIRSIVAYLSGDFEAAAKVELELPETGVCSLNHTSSPSK